MPPVSYTIERNPDYSDLGVNLTKNRRTKDVAKIVGIEAIKNSIYNLVNTNFYEKPFRPSIGSNVRKLLFEHIMPLTATLLQNAISEVIVNYEPRVELLAVVVTPDPENNKFLVAITFKILNVNQPVTINFFLERLR